MEVRLLGPLELVKDGVPTPIGRTGERALLALLSTAPGRTFTKDRLIDALWEEALPANPDNALQVRVSRLRSVVGLALVTEPPGYRLEIDGDAVDAVRFERLVAERRFPDALALWRGTPLAEFAEYAWARAETRRLEELRATAIEEHVDARLAAGDHVSLVAELEGLVSAAPLRERLRGQLMLALYRCGRAADALAEFRTFRETLNEELGVEPSAALRQLEGHMLREDPSLDAPESKPPPRSNLPGLLTAVIGRHQQVRRVEELLTRASLITLTGPGGVGKTTLALATAHDVGSSYRDGVWFVPLARVTEPGRVPDAVAAALGLADPDATSIGRLVTAWLTSRRGLLVLDNCEHVVDVCAHFVEALLRSARDGLQVIATSREALGVPGEVQVPVPPLDEDDAVRLFAQRATSVRGDFDLAGEEPSVRRICEHLDGMPLAIELAAARVNALAPHEIAARLDNRFQLLTTAPRTAEARHQTLRATVDWSHDLLQPPEQTLFRRLAVFQGGWTLAAAEAVCGDPGSGVLDLLSRLVDRSLVVASGGRFRMLETIRAYAAMRLQEAGEQRQLAERHARYFTALAEEAEAGLRGREQGLWLQRLHAEEPNLRLALDWALAHHAAEPDIGLRLSGALGWYWYVGRQLEGRAYLTTMLEAASPGSDEPRARALQAASLLLRPVGCIVHPSPDAAHAARESARLFHHIGDSARAAISQLLVTVEGVAAEDAKPWLARVQAARAALQSAGDPWGEALTDFVEMEIRLHHGEVEPALSLGRRASQAFDALDDAWGRSAVLLHLGFGLRVAGRIDEAEAVLKRAVVLSRNGGLPNNLARSLAELGEAALHRGDADAAEPWFAECQQVASELANDTLLALAALGRGATARLRGDAATAERSYRDALDLSTSNGFAKGAARAQQGLAAVQLDRGDADLDDAGNRLRAVLQQAETINDVAFTAMVLEQLARVTATQGRGENAASLLQQAEALRRANTRPRGALEMRDLERVTGPVAG